MKKYLLKLFRWYFTKQALPYWLLLLVDCAIIFFSLVLTFWLFEKTQHIFDMRFGVLYTSLFYTGLSVIGARLFRTYSGVLRYSSFVDLMHVLYANGFTFVLCLALSVLMQESGHVALAALSQTEILVAFLISTAIMWGIRVLVKTLYDVSFSDQRTLRVLIYGAMSGGIGLAKNIRSQRPMKYKLCGFISHDKRAKHILLMGKEVYHVDDDLQSVIEKQHIGGILVSPLRAEEFRNNQKLQDLFIAAGCKIFMAQMAKEAKVADGQLTDDDIETMQMKEVQVEDLLPRQQITVDLKSVGDLLRDRCVFITGSAGSIGSEMVRQVAKFKPAHMILIDQAETPQHDIRLMMAREFPDVKADTIVCSIDRVTRMDALFRIHRPDYVFHAAAYKHVPMMEDNPSEAVLNNIYGTKVIADLSVKYGVKKFVMISTDKAVNPTNVMGCSKRICEIYVQSLNTKLQSLTSHLSPLTSDKNLSAVSAAPQSGAATPPDKNNISDISAISAGTSSLTSRPASDISLTSHLSPLTSDKNLSAVSAAPQSGAATPPDKNNISDISAISAGTSSLASESSTQFVTTRFGNVLGSNGSVIPLFRKQIQEGGPVTVTDPRIVRFFMLIPEACKLVLEAGTKGHGGEIFVFDMGQPVKIADLAKRMIALSGAKNVKIEYTGLRQGEKLYEEVLNDLEGTKPTFHDKIRIAQVREYDYDEVSRSIDDLISIAKQYDNMATVKKMKELVPEYKSNNSIYEQLDKK